MQRINPAKAMRTALQSEQSKSLNERVLTSPDLDAGTLTRLWIAGVGAWGPKWSKYFGDLPVNDDGSLTVVGALWAKGLGLFDRETVMAALERHIAVGNAWPPNLPELRLSCLGIPSFAQVKRALLRPDGSTHHAFVRSVWSLVETWQLRTAGNEQAEKLLREAYTLALESLWEGNPLPEPPAAEIESQPVERNPPTPEQLERHLAEIRSALGLSMSEAAAMGEDGLRRAGGDV